MRRGERGNSILETALFMPIILLLLVGMVQLAKITYLYYSVRKALYAAATVIATQQGVNFCDSADPLIAAAKDFALGTSADGTTTSIIAGLTADQIQVQTECVDPATQAPGACATSGCGTAAGAQKPDFIILSIPDGYRVTPRFPFFQVDPILLRPEIRVPFGGT